MGMKIEKREIPVEVGAGQPWVPWEQPELGWVSYQRTAFMWRLLNHGSNSNATVAGLVRYLRRGDEL